MVISAYIYGGGLSVGYVKRKKASIILLVRDGYYGS